MRIVNRDDILIEPHNIGQYQRAAHFEHTSQQFVARSVQFRACSFVDLLLATPVFRVINANNHPNRSSACLG